MSVSTCVVSGTITDASGTGVFNAKVRVYPVSPFTDGASDYVPVRKIETTTAADGTFSLTVIRTATISRTMVLEIESPDGGGGTQIQQYVVTIPNASTATLNSLITTP